ncbi:MAG: diadenylate cyclase CdaA [Bacteroidota bacterium]|nr:diadenylate cyclase CdaA [Bacteroidota bacterium]
MDFIEFNLKSILDIVLVALLIYQLYKLVKGTVAINIFGGLAAIYLIWKIVDAFQLQLLSEILGQFIGVGVIILAIVFQQELRKFLMMIGRAKLIKNKGIFRFNFSDPTKKKLNFLAITNACIELSKTKTGAIIVITQIDDLAVFAESGVQMNSKISTPILKSIFYKNSPLHDGAIIIRNNIIVSAKCILPVTNNDNFPQHLGMRHRAACGISEESDAIVIITSEETGDISIAQDGILKKCNADELNFLLKKK